MTQLFRVALLVILCSPLYLNAYSQNCNINSLYDEVIYCGEPLEISVSIESADESCYANGIQCVWNTPEGNLTGNTIYANTPGIYLAEITDCSGCTTNKEIIVSDEELNGGNLINGVSLNFCTGDGTADVIPTGSIAIQNVSGPLSQLLIITYDGQILLKPGVIGEVDWDLLGTGQLLIINVAYSPDLEGLEIGSNIWDDLEGCHDKSNPLYVNLTDCMAEQAELPLIIPLTISDNSLTAYWNEENISSSSLTFQYRSIEDGNWLSLSPSNNILVLAGLAVCTEYELRLRSGEDGDYDYSESLYITTSGCYECPSISTAFAFNTTTSSAILAWDFIIDASYVFKYKNIQDDDWYSFQTPFPVVLLIGLDNCSSYEWYLDILCVEETSNSSSIQILETGCKTEEEIISENVLFPNPSSGTIFFSEQSHITEMEVMNILGKRVYHLFNNDSPIRSVDLSDLDKGTYLLKAKDSGSEITYPLILK